MEKRLRSSLQNSAEEFLSSATKCTTTNKSIKPSLKTLIHHITSSSDLISTLPPALHQSLTQSLDSFKQFLKSNDPASIPSPSTSPPTKKLRKSSRKTKTTEEEEQQQNSLGSKAKNKREFLVQSIEIYAHVTFLCVTHPKKLFSSPDLLPCAQALHDNLLLFETDSSLLVEIAKLCEEWWKEQLPGRETLISQSLPFLLSKSLTLGKKIDVHRVYGLRDAFSLFDFDDESIEDLKNLLLRCVIDPLYLKIDEGRRFVAFLFGLSGQLLKEVLALIRSQIPFGRKSILEAYADIVFRAWKVAEGASRDEIEDGFLQGLIEGEVYASSESLGASIRRVLSEFVSQRTVAGVEKLLFRLSEPVIFRSLQVANSNVRKNALHLLLDVFPLEDPDSTKEVKDVLIDRQFFLLDRLLLDECPDVRVVAVEGSCRIFNLFWEIIPSSTITTTLKKIVNDMSHDVCTEVRRSTLTGITYMLGNPQTHDILKVLLPRLRHLILDSVLSVRVAFVDLLLTLSDIPTIQFHKVVELDALLNSLSDDQTVVAQKITRLLMPSYFPSNVSPEEACGRCITLIKRSPMAGARLCEFALAEGSPPNFLMELARVSFNFALTPTNLNPNQVEGLLVASGKICSSLMSVAAYKASLKKLFSGKKLMQLLSTGPTNHAQVAIFNIASMISPEDVTDLIKECIVQIKNCAGLSLDVEMQAEVRSVHKLMTSCGKFEEMFVALTKLLQIAESECNIKFSTGVSQGSVPNPKQKKAKLSAVRTQNLKGNKTSRNDGTGDFEQHYINACGAAWQIKDLLAFVDSREAMFKSPELDVVFSSLKSISEVSIEQCMHLEYMDTSPVVAYTSLALHAELHSADLPQTNGLGSKKKVRLDSSRSSLKGNVLEKAFNHIFTCTPRLFTENESGDVPQTSRCGPADGGSNCDKKSMLNMVKMVTEILKFIVDATTICPASVNQRKRLQFASACVQAIIATLRKHSHSLIQLNEDLKGTLLCLKSSFSYAVKLLNVILKNMEDSSLPLPEAFSLANNLLNLIMSVDSYFGSKNAVCLIPAVKPWLLDLILALGSSFLKTEITNDQDHSTAMHHDISCCLPWLRVLAKLELHELSEDDGDNIIYAPSEFSVFKEVVEMAVLVLRRNLKILDSVGVTFLAGLTVLMEKEEYELVLGVVHFVCVKLVSDEYGEWAHLQVMLASLRELYPRIKNCIEVTADEEQKQMLESAEALLQPVWISYVHEDGEE